MSELIEDAEKLNKYNSKLERMMAKMGTSADDSSLRNQMATERDAAKGLAKQMMANAKKHKTDKQALKKFEAALTAFNKISQEIEKKQTAVVRMSQSHRDSQLNGGDAKSTPKQTPINQQVQQDGDIQIEILQMDVDEIDARKNDIQQIERDVREVGEMFKDLAVLVNEQQDSIDVIENNINKAKENVQVAHTDLVQAEEYQKAARKKQCLILLALLIALVVIIVPSTLKATGKI